MENTDVETDDASSVRQRKRKRRYSSSYSESDEDYQRQKRRTKKSPPIPPEPPATHTRATASISRVNPVSSLPLETYYLQFLPDTDSDERLIGDDRPRSNQVTVQPANNSSSDRNESTSVPAFLELIELVTQVITTLEEVRFNQVQQAQQLAHLSRRLESAGMLGSVEAGALPEDLKFPLTSEEQLKELDNKLQDKDTKLKMIRYLASVGGDSVKDMVKRTMRQILSNDLSLKMNFSGVKGKVGFKNYSVKDALFAAIQQVHKTSTQLDIETTVRAWLVSARDREGGRTKRAKQRKIRLTSRRGKVVSVAD
ncbi:uncharacterized protein LOC143293458 isoform X2 [Babylonia areolata]